MKIRLGDLRRIVAEEALGLHGAGMGEKELRGSLGYGGIELNKDGSITDEELPDWGPSAQGSADDVVKQQQNIIKHRKDASKKTESVLRKYFREILYNSLQEMLTIRTMVAPSTIEGSGLYTAEFIPKGTVVSKWIEGFDKVFPGNYPESLDSSKKKSFMIYASWDGDSWFLSGDDGIYFNHSKSPNIRVIMGRNSPATWDRVAVRDIQPGEELTMDYREIGLDFI